VLSFSEEVVMDDFEKELIRRGAEAELADMRTRMGKLEALLSKGPRPGRGVTVKRSSGRRPMSAAAKAAASKRMKAYWAAKRKAAK
jgi:hypothetical protein